MSRADGVFPARCWFQIASFLDASNLFSLRCVSRMLNKIASDDVLWKPICEVHHLCFDKTSLETYMQRFVRKIHISRIEDELLGRGGQTQNISSAISKLVKMAEKSDHHAMAILGMWGNYDSAATIPFAAQYLACSQHPVAIYASGRGTVQDLVSARDDLDFLICYELAKCYDTVLADPKLAQELFFAAAVHGLPLIKTTVKAANPIAKQPRPATAPAARRPRQLPLSTEARIIADMQAHQFKARPVSRKALDSAGEVGVPRVAKRPTTAAAPFQLKSQVRSSVTRLHSVKNTKKVEEEAALKFTFRARPVPSGKSVFQPSKSVKPLTEITEFTLNSDKRAEVVRTRKEIVVNGAKQQRPQTTRAGATIVQQIRA
eukprot:TRINITY_DN14109_c0_g1_i1.p1 TRINITY_DN14109_c0_g1~~TRINITY_DN14109_c0_g1_i1.p1  ORF type:complete len:397 (-),score=87.46 TRINITY_DN14109_c0_g1_i1:122-1246(-)